MTGRGVKPAQVRQWVESTCAAQGVPVVVTDRGVLARVGVLIGGTRGKPPGARDRLQPPLGINPVRVQTVPPGLGRRPDDGIVEDGLHDGRLAG